MPPAVIDLSDLDGTNGFALAGSLGQTGHSVSSAGDVNDDGLSDVIIGAGSTAYVVYGSSDGFGASISLTDLDGGDGFRLNGLGEGSFVGRCVAGAGDVNGDGIDDFLASAPGAESSAGQTYVVFGKSHGFGAAFNVANLNGTNGFVVQGANPGDVSGWISAPAGDVNGDGFADILLGAYGVDVNGVGNAGAAYVVFGKADGFESNFDLAALDGGNGFRFHGSSLGDHVGGFVSMAGDVNNDGYDDILVGADRMDPHGKDSAGSAFVIFGKAGGFDADFGIDDLTGANGFRLNGVDAVDRMGHSVSTAGDINADGYADLLVGAIYGNPDGRNNAGTSYVVLGKAGGFDAVVELADLDGTNGFRLDGRKGGPDYYGDKAGFSTNRAGDVNADGFDDIIIGAPGADGGAGTAYVVFGKATGFSSTIALADLDGTEGFEIDGISGSTGDSVASAGDVNGDGIDDMVVGAPGATDAYVIFGVLPDEAVTRVGTDIGQTIRGGAFDDVLDGLGGDDRLVAGDGDDFLSGGRGADILEGGLGDDRLFAGNGADTLLGGEGDDLVVGRGRADVMSGGTGSDVFLFRQVRDSYNSARDTITDLSADDLIDLRLIDADTSTAGDQSFHLAAGFTGAAGELVLIYQAGRDRSVLRGDVDGDGKADFGVILEGDQSDFSGFVL